MSFGAILLEKALHYDFLSEKSDDELKEIIDKYDNASTLKKLFSSYYRDAETAKTILQRRQDGKESRLIKTIS